jgi:predicted molibdopterin-dependent oxidoreductase YjgC
MQEEFAEEKLAKIASRLSRHNYKEEATRLANDMYNKFEEIRKLENLYLDQKMQREIVRSDDLAECVNICDRCLNPAVRELLCKAGFSLSTPLLRICARR